MIFKIEEPEIRSAIDDAGIELTTGEMEELYDWVGDWFENLMPQELADAVGEFIGWKGSNALRKC